MAKLELDNTKRACIGVQNHSAFSVRGAGPTGGFRTPETGFRKGLNRGFESPRMTILACRENLKSFWETCYFVIYLF